MKLWLVDHAYKYAAEQIMLTQFPGERPEYPDTPAPKRADMEENSAVLKITRSGRGARATATICRGGKTARSFASAGAEEPCDKLGEDRALQRILKSAFYRAAVKLTGTRSQWGSLTGIRPGKIAARLIKGGMTDKETVRYMMREYDASPARAKLCVDAAKAGIDAERTLRERDIALYIGIPFCPTRCAYCSFVSIGVERSFALIDPFLDALYREIDAVSRIVNDLNLNVVSVYIGGGTPTTLDETQLDALLKKLAGAFDLSSVRDYTVEAGRPDTITAEKMAALYENGVGRVSINPQTMRDDVLRAIGRKHTAADIVTAVRTARDAKMGIINMDLIAGLPEDTVSGFKYTLDAVLELRPENVTVHTLALKKGSRITLEKTAIPGAEEVEDMLSYAQDRLTKSEFSPYYLYRQKFTAGGFENTGWSKKGYENLYNICIMEELRSIIALGGGGSTKLVDPKTGRIERVFNAKYPLEYIENIEKCIARKGEIAKFYNECQFG